MAKRYGTAAELGLKPGDLVRMTFEKMNGRRRDSVIEIGVVVERLQQGDSKVFVLTTDDPAALEQMGKIVPVHEAFRSFQEIAPAETAEPHLLRLLRLGLALAKSAQNAADAARSTPR